ncbi:MAG TPA: hypothetical protein VNG33_09625, partial [Polyangiaceae bacterium]|nr:hypothetical protein [Polyangiaceae bacterium]
MIGAKLRPGETEEVGGSAAVVVASGGSAGGGNGGSESVVPCSPSVANCGAADAGGATTVGGGGAGGAGGAPDVPETWCATSPWLNVPAATFTGPSGSVIPAGSYVLTYVSGAQIHDAAIGYEVTRHYYGMHGLEAGHHLFSGDSPETGATSLWLDQIGIVGYGGTIAEVEAKNSGHTWPLEHADGELHITLYDDDYHDNAGPGSHFCV